MTGFALALMPLVVVPRQRLYELLLLALSAWVLIHILHLLTPSDSKWRKVVYWAMAVVAVAWATGVVRIGR